MSLVKLVEKGSSQHGAPEPEPSGTGTAHTEQQAASTAAECQTDNRSSWANPTRVGKQEEKVSAQGPSPSAGGTDS